MAQDFMLYWKWSNVEEWAAKSLPCVYAASVFFCSGRAGHQNDELAWRVDIGDTLWIVSAPTPQPSPLYLRGRIEVGHHTGDPDEVERLIGRRLYWRKPVCYVVARDTRGMPFARIDLSNILSDLTFQRENGTHTNLTVTDGGITGQDFQSMRRLTPASAALLTERWEKAQARATATVSAMRQRGDTDLS